MQVGRTANVLLSDYVLQQALRYAEGEQFTALVNKIRPQIATLRRFSNIYHKHLAASESLEG